MGATGTSTILFTDLVRSTEVMTTVGDEAYEQRRQEHFRLMRAAIVAHRGREVKTVGDSFMVAFGSTRDAIDSAVAMQQAVHRSNLRHVDAPLDMRVGIHVGEVTEEGGDYFGPPVVAASRLCAVAAAGQILASEIVVQMAGPGRYTTEALGLLRLKGFDGPMAAVAIQWAPTASTSALPRELEVAGRGGFVSRARELALLEERWRAASAGAGTTVLVSGDPGVGKSRLAAELARRAQASGGAVIFGRCDEEAVAPYQPFVQALEGLAASVDVEMPPELGLLLPSLPAPAEATDRYRLFEAVRRMLAAVAGEQPVLVVLDDLHWADAPTLLLLKHLVRAAPDLPILLLGTYRETDLSRTHPLADALIDLRRERLVDRVALRGFDREGVAALIEDRAGHEVPAEFVAAVHEQTEGNPFFVEEVLLHLAEAGVVEQRAGEWTSSVPVESMGIPESIREVIGRRLRRLSVEANEVLSRAAVLGREFELDVVSAMPGVERDAFERAIDDAVGASIVVERDAAPPTCAFSHALIRQTLYEELTLPRRQRRHLDAAVAIETVHAGDVARHLPALAMHFRLAGAAADPAKAMTYSLAAAQAAADVLAWEEAAPHLEGALELSESQGAPAAVRASLHQRLGDLYYVSGIDLEAGLRHLEKALALFEEAGDEDQVALMHSRLGRSLSTQLEVMDMRAAANHYHQALTVMARHPDSRRYGYIHAGLATVALWQSDPTAGLETSAAAMDLGERLGDPVLWTTAAALHGHHLYGTGRPGESSELLERSWQVANGMNHAFNAFLATWVVAAWRSDDPLDGNRWCERELAQPRIEQAPFQRTQLAQLLLAGHLETGHMSEAEAVAARYGLNPADWLVPFRVGDWVALAAMCDTNVVENERRGCLGPQGGAMAAGVFWRISLGDLTTALRLYERASALAVDHFIGVPQTVQQAVAASRLALHLGRPELSSEWVARAEELTSHADDWRAQLAQVRTAAAFQAHAEARWDDAEVAYGEAIDTYGRYSLRWWEAEVRGYRAAARRAAGDEAGAAEDLEAAVLTLRAMGAGQPWIDLVESVVPPR